MRILLTLSLTLCFGEAASAQSWQYIAPMDHARYFHRTILLNTGEILVIGGTDGNQVLNSCELYNPTSNSWKAAASLNVARYCFQASLLEDGRVFVSGGLTDMGNQTSAACEIYDPASDTWRMTTSMNEAREEHDACVIPGNKVVLIGGLDANVPVYLNTADLFDVATQTITALPPLLSATAFADAIYSPTASAIFVCGGNQAGWGGFKTRITQKFSLADWKWTLVDSMIDRQGAQFNTVLSPISNEIYLLTNDTAYEEDAPHLRLTTLVESLDLDSGVWNPEGAITPRTDPRSIVVDDSVVITGGVDNLGNQIANVSWYNFKSQQSREATPLLEPISQHSNIYLSGEVASDNCKMVRRLYVIGGRTTGNRAVTDCEMLDLGDIRVAGNAQLHREGGASYYGELDTLPMLVDINSQINLDSLSQYIQDISGSYSWDSSIVSYVAYLPPQGWFTTSLSTFGDSVAFTIHKLSGFATSQLSLGAAIFIPESHVLATSWVNLAQLTMLIGNQTIALCVTDNEDSHWAVKVLGAAGVDVINEPKKALSIKWLRVENGNILIGFQTPQSTFVDLRADVFDVMGRKVLSSASVSSSSVTALLNAQSLTPGVYYVRLSDGQSAALQKLVLFGR